MDNEISKTYSKILELIKDCERYYEAVEHKEILIEDINVIRNDEGMPIELQVVTKYITS